MYLPEKQIMILHLLNSLRHSSLHMYKEKDHLKAEIPHHTFPAVNRSYQSNPK